MHGNMNVKYKKEIYMSHYGSIILLLQIMLTIPLEPTQQNSDGQTMPKRLIIIIIIIIIIKSFYSLWSIWHP